MPTAPNALPSQSSFAALRLLQIRVLASALPATAELSRRASKRDALAELVVATRAIPGNLTEPGRLAALADLEVTRLIASTGACVRTPPKLSSSESAAVLIELAVSANWAAKD